MKYISTRGQAPELDFAGAVLAGLAEDGGLYVPKEWPTFAPHEIAGFAGLSYPELALRIVKPFVAGSIPDAELAALLNETYATFRHPAVAPMVQLESKLWVMELFHGETLAFKDFALQFLGRVFSRLLGGTGQKALIVGATSGDTGSAAIAGCRARPGIGIVILHPHGRVSDVQRRMMTSVLDANVRNVAIDGTFDDCQNIVKALFRDLELKRNLGLTAINSINWARILAQVVYYFYAACALGAPARTVRFAVPTGNFGDIYAGYVATRMGLPIEQLIIATNRNDILHRFMQTGEYRTEDVEPTVSPSIDIQVASNFERLLFEAHERDSSALNGLMDGLRTHGRFSVAAQPFARIQRQFASGRTGEAETMDTIRAMHRQTGYLADPHTAVGIHAARERLAESESPIVCLATAHPAKFPDAVHQASGVTPALPPHCADLTQRPERCDRLPASMEAVRDYLLQNQGITGA